MKLLREFQHPGPTIAAMLRSRARIVGVMGPQGGGKTTGMIVHVLHKASLQPRSPLDGVARYRCIVWMRTYRELWSKVIPDWLEWVPMKAPGIKIDWIGGRDNPAEHNFTFKVMDAGAPKIVQAQVWFRAVGDQTPFEAAKGLHPTDGWLPEATSATEEMRIALAGRLGRYPAAEHGGAPHRQLLCDWNAGDPYNWTSRYFILEKPEGLVLGEDGVPLVEFFRQPGGREAGAENLHNLPPGYYEDQIELNADNPDWIRRMIDNKLGFIRDGKPVYDTFDEDHHVAKAPLVPWRGVPLLIAADAGLTPAAVIGQRNDFGEWQILDEIVTGAGQQAGAEAFGKRIAEVLDGPRYAGIPKPKIGWADPSSGNALEASSEGENATLLSWMKIVSAASSINFRPSRCRNNPVIRQAGVRVMLNRRVGQRTAAKFDPSMRHTITACARDYHFRRRKIETGLGTEYDEAPAKNFASHVANALEYLAANGGEQEIATGEAERRKQRQLQMRQAQMRKPQGGRRDPLAAYGRA